MNTPTNKKQGNKSRSVANTISQPQSKDDFTFQALDNLPEPFAQKELREPAGKNPKMKPVSAFQEIADNSSQAKHAAQLQAKADKYSARRQHIPKKDNRAGLPDNTKTSLEKKDGVMGVKALMQGMGLIHNELPHAVQQNGELTANQDKSLEQKTDVAIQRKITDGWGNNLSNESIAKLMEMFQYRHGDGDIIIFHTVINHYQEKQAPITLANLVNELKSKSDNKWIRVGHLLSLILHQFQDWASIERDEISGEKAWDTFALATRIIRNWVANFPLLNTPGQDEEAVSLLHPQPSKFEVPRKDRETVMKVKPEQWQAAAVAATRAGWLSGIGFLELKRALEVASMGTNNVIKLRLSRDVVHEGLQSEAPDMVKVGTVQIPEYAVTEAALNEALPFFSSASFAKSGQYSKKFGIILKELDVGHKLVDKWENMTHREKGKHVDENVKFNFLALLSPKENSQEVIGANGQVLGDGSYMYTIDPSFRVRYMPAANYVGEGGTAKNFFQFIPHSQLASLGAVVAAGNFVIAEGKFKWIDNGSGHYRVNPSVNASNARAALINLGYDISQLNFLSRGGGDLDKTYQEGNKFLEGLPKGQERPIMTREIQALQGAMDQMH